MSHLQTTPEQQQQNQHQNDLETRTPDLEVMPKAKSRQFAAESRPHILHEADARPEPGQIRAPLQREGLHSSHLSNWRRLRKERNAAFLCLPWITYLPYLVFFPRNATQTMGTRTWL